MKLVKYMMLIIAVPSTLLSLLLGTPELRLQLKGDERDIEYFIAWLGLVSFVTACLSWTLFFTRSLLEERGKESTARLGVGCILIVLLLAGAITYFWKEMIRP